MSTLLYSRNMEGPDSSFKKRLFISLLKKISVLCAFYNQSRIFK